MRFDQGLSKVLASQEMCMTGWWLFPSIYNTGFHHPLGKILYTSNELALLTHSFYTCLKPPLSSDNCTLQVYIPWFYSCVVIYSSRNFILSKKFTISHVAAQRDRLNYITNSRMHTCISLTDNVTWSIR